MVAGESPGRNPNRNYTKLTFLSGSGEKNRDDRPRVLSPLMLLGSTSATHDHRSFHLIRWTAVTDKSGEEGSVKRLGEDLEVKIIIYDTSYNCQAPTGFGSDLLRRLWAWPTITSDVFTDCLLSCYPVTPNFYPPHFAVTN